MELIVHKTGDFDLDGRGDNAAWRKTEWLSLTRVSGTTKHATRAKMLYSEKGLYYLFDCEDKILACTHTVDSSDTYLEDVVEIYIWPDESKLLYFEYQLSPLRTELALMIANDGRVFQGWQPWHYEGERRTRRATSVRGGARAPYAQVEGWTAEFFIPYALLKGFTNIPPQPGMKWRGNLYRIDYDDGSPSHSAWDHRTGHEFHDYEKFGTLIFQ